MKHKLIHFIALLLLMVVTGVFWGTWFTLTRSLDAFAIDEFIHIGKVIIANVAMPMRLIMPACILCMLLSLWFYQPKKSTGFYLNAAACVLIIVTLIITLGVLVPIDNEIKLWTAATAPANQDEIRLTWQNFHGYRTFTSLASFALFSLSIILMGNQAESGHHYIQPHMGR